MSTALAVPLAVGQASLLREEDDVAAESKDQRLPVKRGRLSTEDAHHESRSLDDLIADTWEGLVKGTSQCPVCGGRLEPQFGAHARPVGGRCADCGSTIR
jgi:hypothetical protein